MRGACAQCAGPACPSHELNGRLACLPQRPPCRYITPSMVDTWRSEAQATGGGWVGAGRGSGRGPASRSEHGLPTVLGRRRPLPRSAPIRRCPASNCCALSPHPLDPLPRRILQLGVAPRLPAHRPWRPPPLPGQRQRRGELLVWRGQRVWGRRRRRQLVGAAAARPACGARRQCTVQSAAYALCVIHVNVPFVCQPCNPESQMRNAVESPRHNPTISNQCAASRPALALHVP